MCYPISFVLLSFHIWKYIYICVCVCVCIHIYVCICMYLYIYTQTHTHTYIFICMCIYTHVYVYTYIYTLPRSEEVVRNWRAVYLKKIFLAVYFLMVKMSNKKSHLKIFYWATYKNLYRVVVVT